MTENRPGDAQERQPDQMPAADPVPAWEEIEAGRYMPRRIKGSCRGAKLG